ncbi:unnamed protein product [Sympodiomycopsis kandeliae]
MTGKSPPTSLKEPHLLTSTTSANDVGYLAPAGGLDPERLSRLRSRVAVDTRGRLMDPDMERARISGNRKLDLRAVPPLLLMWLFNFIDRTSIGNARIAGMEKDLGLKGLQFNTALAVFYIFYILAEVPSNLVLKRIGANIWLPSIIIAWGIITTLTGIVKNYAGLLVIRSFLGLSEGGLLPGMTLYLSTLYSRGELQTSISGSFGGLLAYALTHVTTAIPPLHHWSWIFIAEGIITVGIGFIAMAMMPRSVQTTSCLTEAEREACLMAMNEHQERDTIANSDFEKALTGTHKKEEHMIPEEESLEFKEVIRGVTDIQVWLTGIAYLCICNSLYSFTLFLPTILAGLYPDSDQAQIQLLTVPPFVPAAVMVIVVAYFADRYRIRHPFILAFLPISIIGYIMLIASTNNQVRYGAVFLVALGVYPSVPCLLSILPNNFAGHYKKATSVAVQLAVANCAGFVASFIYIADQFGPNYITSHAVMLASLVLAWIMILVNMLHCQRINRLKENGKMGQQEERWRQERGLANAAKQVTTTKVFTTYIFTLGIDECPCNDVVFGM